MAAALAGCGGGDSKTFDSACQGRLQAIARYHTVVDLYRRGELGTRAKLEKWAGETIPFLDDRGRIIPFERMNEQQHLRTDHFTLKVAGLNNKTFLAVSRADRRAKREAATRCA